MNISFESIGRYLTKKKLWGKPLGDFNKFEMEELCQAILEAVESKDGFEPPFIDDRGRLIIPFRAPIKYRYWQGGQTIMETLNELKASDEINKRYIPTGSEGGMPKDRYIKIEANETCDKKNGDKGNTYAGSNGGII